MLVAAISPTGMLLCTLIAVVGLIVLIARFKVHAFVALILASVFVGLCSPMPLLDVARAFQEGVGNTLGFIAVVVGLGTMLGKLLAESGGAEVVARTFIRWLGIGRLPLAMVIIAFVVGLPVFFGVGVLLLIPIVLGLARETRLPLLALGLPLVAGLSASHCLVPPHVGPMVAIEKLHADLGKTIVLSSFVGFPIALVVGLWYSKWAGRRFQVELPTTSSGSAPTVTTRGRVPGFGITLFTIALPVLLMLLDTLAKLTLPVESPIRTWAGFTGSPLVSMTVALLFSLYSFGFACGFDRRQLLKFAEDCLGPAASIILIVGAGGGFSKVLDKAGVAEIIATVAKGLPLSPLVLGWLIAALIRVAVGSATVTITMTAGIIAPLVAQSPGTNPELVVIALGAGSMIASHLNDGGFWFVKEYLNMTVLQTLKTWTVMTSIIAVLVLIVTAALDVFL